MNDIARKIQHTLCERGQRYGDFACNCQVSQELWRAIESSPKFHDLPNEHREALRMIFHKIARIVCGDPLYADNVHDIIGYATLLEDFIISENKRMFEDLRDNEFPE